MGWLMEVPPATLPALNQADSEVEEVQFTR
jgi:hypothetical protein